MKPEARSQESEVRSQESEFAGRIAAVQSLNGSAEIQIGWTALIEAFSNHWAGCGMSGTELNVYVGASPHEFLKVGWLREERRAAGSLFWPAGQLLDYLARDVETEDRSQESGVSGQEAAAIHISTVPFPQVVPTPTGTIPVREIEPGASNRSHGTTGTDAVPLSSRTGGRWDPRPTRATPLQRDLEEMIGALRIVSEETRGKLTELCGVQEMQDWNQRETMLQGVTHLRRLASDLYNHLGDAELAIAATAFQTARR